MDVVLGYGEVNDRYGTGVLLQRMFPRHRDEVLYIRSVTIWGGEQRFGAHGVAIPPGLDRAAIAAWVVAATQGFGVERIYCVPYATEELLAAVALHDACGAPLCLYVMDDQNVAADGIPDAVMDEAVAKARLRLAISSDMRDAYEAKYRRRFWIAPPTMPAGVRPVPAAAGNGRAVLVGNISAQEWLEALLAAQRGSPLTVDWFANSEGGGHWLRRATLDGLAAAGVTVHDPLPERRLAARLGAYEVALIPTMPPGGRGENFAIASLSLPSRLTFLVGSSDLPVVVLGDPRSCVARFVEHFGLGTCCDYDARAVAAALVRMRDPAWRAGHAAALDRLRGVLGSVDAATWVRASLEAGEPVDLAYEALDVPSVSAGTGRG